MRGRVVDLKDQRFGDWLVIRRVHSSKTLNACWRVRCCACGREKTVIGANLRSPRATNRCSVCRPPQPRLRPKARHPFELLREIVPGAVLGGYRKAQKYAANGEPTEEQIAEHVTGYVVEAIGAEFDLGAGS